MTNASVLTSIETVVTFLKRPSYKNGAVTEKCQTANRGGGGGQIGYQAVGTATNFVVPHRATIILAQIGVPQSTFISVDKFILMTS